MSTTEVEFDTQTGVVVSVATHSAIMYVSDQAIDEFFDQFEDIKMNFWNEVRRHRSGVHPLERFEYTTKQGLTISAMKTTLSNDYWRVTMAKHFPPMLDSNDFKSYQEYAFLAARTVRIKDSEISKFMVQGKKPFYQEIKVIS